MGARGGEQGRGGRAEAGRGVDDGQRGSGRPGKLAHIDVNVRVTPGSESGFDEGGRTVREGKRLQGGREQVREKHHDLIASGGGFLTGLRVRSIRGRGGGREKSSQS
eukprot:3086214-Rhodomonas_salina.1